MKRDGKYRFSLQFGTETTEQIQAGELLERLGNRKSAIVYMSWQISNFALAALIRCHCKSAFITVELEVNKIRERINAHMEKLITRKEAAKILGVSIATLDAARQSGLISYVQYVPNGCVYFTETALQEYVAKCTRKAKPAENNLTYRKPRSPKKKK